MHIPVKTGLARSVLFQMAVESLDENASRPPSSWRMPMDASSLDCFGAVRLLRSSAQGILVSSAAVIREGDSAYIFVSKWEMATYVRRDVKLGRSIDGMLEIVSGLERGRDDRFRRCAAFTFLLGRGDSRCVI